MKIVLKIDFYVKIITESQKKFILSYSSSKTYYMMKKWEKKWFFKNMFYMFEKNKIKLFVTSKLQLSKWTNFQS